MTTLDPRAVASELEERASLPEVSDKDRLRGCAATR